ncbi:MAG TPA: YciI family protein [Solirubrobacteraceae bacterium]|nr:YciI family protein [Solirubrobacteraceae bacterium]
MRYALLIYNDEQVMAQRGSAERGRITDEIREVLDRSYVLDWMRLKGADSATSVAESGSRSLLTDGPFLDSKDYLGGLILIDVADLDAALAVARELQEIRGSGAIEIRPLLEARADRNG